MAKGATKKAISTPREHWGREPDEHDYPAATDYLTLLIGTAQADRIVTTLRDAPLLTRKAKDLLRASRLPLLSQTNVHVRGDLKKVAQGKPLSPVLLVRGDLLHDVPLTVADGYHRICASYYLNENADIPCHIVDAPRGTPRRSSPSN
jgi:hypothetical protein